MQRRNEPPRSEGLQDEGWEYAGSEERQRAEEVRESAKESGRQVRERAAQTGQKVKEQADAGIDRAAERVESMAGRLRETAVSQEGVTAEVGSKVADRMERTAGYLREHDTQEIMDDVEKYVRDHPMQAVAGALVGGFIIARILR